MKDTGLTVQDSMQDSLQALQLKKETSPPDSPDLAPRRGGFGAIKNPNLVSNSATGSNLQTTKAMAVSKMPSLDLSRLHSESPRQQRSSLQVALKLQAAMSLPCGILPQAGMAV